MEVLSLLLEETAIINPDFQFHPKCHSLELNHLCFVDDLLIFSAAKLNSVRAIKGVLGEFEGLSGLRANPAKSSVFCAGMSLAEKGDILELMEMKEGPLLVRYLGVPLITKRLSAADCESLFTKISARIDSWPVKHLSFAGRLQLLSYFLFILPKKIICLLEQNLIGSCGVGKILEPKLKLLWRKFVFQRRKVVWG
jgi:hypothetical protein